MEKEASGSEMCLPDYSTLVYHADKVCWEISTVLLNNIIAHLL